MSAMDPHYLQRVAIAGSRIGASVKPPVAGPPQMPGSVWSSLRPVSTDLTLPPDAEDYAQLGSRPASASPRAEIVDFDPESERAVVEERRPIAAACPGFRTCHQDRPPNASRTASIAAGCAGRTAGGNPARPVSRQRSIHYCAKAAAANRTATTGDRGRRNTTSDCRRGEHARITGDDPRRRVALHAIGRSRAPRLAASVRSSSCRGR